MGSVFIDPADLPETALGNIQLLELFVVYAYLLYIGCTMISDGAELLMLTPYSKLVGSCILPVLGAVPDGAIVLFSGLGPNAQSSLDVGVGALAGSTVMLITIPWALAIYGGRVNLDESGAPRYAVPRGQPRLWPESNYFKAGVSVGAGYDVVLAMALWMLVTSTPYFVVEIGALVAEAKHGGIANQQDVDDDQAKTLALEESPAALVALLLSVTFFVTYLAFQYRQAYGGSGDAQSPALKERARAATVNTVKNGVGIVAAIRPVLEAHKHDSSLEGDSEQIPLASGLCVTHDAMLKSVLSPFFRRYDVDNSKTLSRNELGLVFTDMNEPKSESELADLFKEYDKDGSGQLSFDEFVLGMKKYVENKPTRVAASRRGSDPTLSAEAIPVLAKDPPSFTADEDDEEEEEMPEEFAESKFRSVAEQQSAIQHTALVKCIVGTIVVLVFSDPITDVLDEVGARTGIRFDLRDPCRARVVTIIAAAHSTSASSSRRSSPTARSFSPRILSPSRRPPSPWSSPTSNSSAPRS